MTLSRITGWITSVICVSMTLSTVAAAQQTFYDEHALQRIELFFVDPTWEAKLDTLKATTDGYLPCDSIRINGTVLKNVGVKFKGNSSYSPAFRKKSLHIALDKYVDQTYQNIPEIKLNNCYQDPSMIREVLAYHILRKYMKGSRCNGCMVWINGSYEGFFSNVEDVSKTFCASQFRSTKTNTFIKCCPLTTPTLGLRSNLKYISGDSADYQQRYELKSSSGWSDVLNVCSLLKDNSDTVEKVLDLDRFCWMLAFNNALVNLDSYSGAFSQNYYLFKDNSGVLNPIVWDLNMSFGGFPFVGSGASSLGTLSVEGMLALKANSHAEDSYYPVIQYIHANQHWKAVYYAHLKTLVEEMYSTGYADSVARELHVQFSEAVAADTNKFFSNEEFDNAFTSNIKVGSYSVPALSTLMEARKSTLMSTEDVSAEGPTISEVSVTVNQQSASATFTTRIQQSASTVKLGLRANLNKRFDLYDMFDDGMHDDATAGDGIYGLTIDVDTAYGEFYVVASNSAATTFSPRRAEHEFFSVKSFRAVTSVFEEHPDAALFPNPASTTVQIPRTKAGISCIVNAAGSVVAVYDVSHGSSEYVSIDVSLLPSGAYRVVMPDNTYSLTVLR